MTIAQATLTMETFDDNWQPLSVYRPLNGLF